MKKIIFSLVVTLFIFSCAKEKSANNTDSNVLSKIQSAQLIEASNNFTFKLLHTVDSMTFGHNTFISPLSIQQALSMTLNGAKGNTFEDMEIALSFDNVNENEINAYNKSLVDALLNADNQVIYEIANSIWSRTGFEVEHNFIEVNRDFYNAEVSTCDFSDPKTLIRINDWCSDKTHGKVQNVLDQIPPEAVMYLINALYFKGTWQYSFDKKRTSGQDFFLEDGTQINHDQMVLEATLDLYKGANFSVVALPYGKGDFRMMIVLPEAGKALSETISGLDANGWKAIVQQMTPKKVIVRMPKFKFEFKSILNDVLTKMGMGIAFTAEADFSGINKYGGLLISRVIHKTFVEVNEEGTEAAAVTVVEIIKTSMPNDSPIQFTANRPFMYFITEKSTNAIIFAGKMIDPTETKFEME